MSSRPLSALALTLATFLAAPAVAQTLTVEPAVLTEGSTAEVTYNNPKLAGQTVVIRITDGTPKGPVVQIEVLLNSNGDGKAGWTVPGWSDAHFSAPGASDVYCPVVPR